MRRGPSHTQTLPKFAARSNTKFPNQSSSPIEMKERVKPLNTTSFPSRPHHTRGRYELAFSRESIQHFAQVGTQFGKKDLTTDSTDNTDQTNTDKPPMEVDSSLSVESVRSVVKFLLQ